MRQPHLLQTQLRALLRAAARSSGSLRIMLPMIATLEDMAWGRAQLAAAAASLAAEGVAHRADVPLGIMVETPAAAITADLLAQQAAFFSVGSNDLAQYTLAADRGIAELAATYPHASIAVLRLIERAASAARQAGIPIGICGELAADTAAAPLLVGMGLDELSMAPAAIPAVKERLQTLTLAQMQEQAREALQ
jgi:phosphotransferase system enzyme I (PtsI)